MLKKTLGYLFYVIGVVFTISYFRESILFIYEYFIARDWSLLLLSFVGFILNISFTAILFVYARKWTRKRPFQTAHTEIIGPVKRILGFVLFPLGILFIISFIGNIYVLLSTGIPDTNLGKYAVLMALVMTVVFVTLCFKYGIKWTKKQPKLEVDNIGKE